MLTEKQKKFLIYGIGGLIGAAILFWPKRAKASTDVPQKEDDEMEALKKAAQDAKDDDASGSSIRA